MKTTITTLLAGASMLGMASTAVLATAGSADATTLRFASGWPPGATPSRLLEEYAVALREATDGDLTIRVFPLSLLNFAESNAGVRDGVADMTFNLMAYFPSDFPNINMASEFSQIAELEQFASELSSTAFTGAINEFIMLHCPDCMAEVAEQNQLYLGGLSTTTYALQCMMPLETADDLRGKRIRAAGAFWSRWIESVGATPVSMSINETLEALNQGVVDCTASNTADFVNFGLIDVVRYVHVGLPGAQFLAPITMNLDSWRDLSDEQREQVLRFSSDVSAAVTWAYIEEARSGRERAPELGIEYGIASQELLDLNAQLIEADLELVASVYQERFGIENGDEVAAQLTELMERWTALTSEVSSADELAEIYYNELFSRVDLATFGQ
ncbi:MAG: C4-dicarboxylate TRAP transporter substrate-binding protein [Pararhodobacter sp.]|nr:C4-dicarboxylate TRAP transporter substrate-binding protein [Pararhodobacter sp.]